MLMPVLKDFISKVIRVFEHINEIIEKQQAIAEKIINQ